MVQLNEFMTRIDLSELNDYMCPAVSCTAESAAEASECEDI